MFDFGGPWWIIIDVVAVVILGAAIAYGVLSWRKRRSPGAERARNDATRDLYQKGGD